MIVDAHMHLWNRVHGRVGRSTPVRPLSGGMIRIGDRAVLGMPAYMHDCAAYAEYVLGEFDAAGIDAGVVVQESLDGPQNDYLLQVARQHPDRFFMHALPNCWQLDRVEREADALFARGFRGLKLSAAHLRGEIPLDHPKLMPIWRMMERHGYVLAVDLSDGQDQVAEMQSILDACPALRVALGHLGMPSRGGWPGQLDLGRRPQVYLDAGGLVWLYRHEGYPFPGATDALRRARDEVGIEKLMWGLDWPRTMVDFTYRQSLDYVRCCDQFTEDEKAKLLGESASRLYRLSTSTIRRASQATITES